MMTRNAWFFTRGVIILAFGALAFFSLELALEWNYPLSGLTQFDAEEARNLIVLLNKALNQSMAVVFIAVGIAVPLTANIYSPKFLEFFIKNPVNAIVLVFVIFANLNCAWIGYTMKNDYIPTQQLNIVFILTIVCLVLIFPYLNYIFRFLHPNTLLNLLEEEISDCLRRARRLPDASAIQGRVAETLEHIADIAIRSLERSDRSTAIQSVLTLEQAARNYWAIKEKLSPPWFETKQDLFSGFPLEVVEEVTMNRDWVEMKLYCQLLEVLRAACPRMPELTSTISKSLCRLALEDQSREDRVLRELAIDHFNTFLRLAINRKDVRSLFIIFDQYRTFAEALNETHPQEALEIAYYFEYYGQAARQGQLPFVVETVAHDLGYLVRRAWETGAANKDKLLERFLHLDRQAASPLPGVLKAQALLAGYFLLSGQTDPVAQIRNNFQNLDPTSIASLKEDVIHVKRRNYWEIGERRMNIDYVPEPQREKVREFFESLQLKERA